MASAQRQRSSFRRRRLGLGLAVLAAAAVAVGVAVGASGGSSGGASSGDQPLPALPAPRAAQPPRSGDPFAYQPARPADFAARATAGAAHVLYAKSPDGVFATASRVARWRGLTDRATAGSPVDPATLEAIVFLESAGLPNEIAGPDPASASGLTQIEAGTGQSLLGMHIDLTASRRLTRQIGSATAAGNQARASALERQRARIDERFSPAGALAGTVRYLELAQARFGRGDLAVESYHMGIGNLANVLSLYGSGGSVPYVQLYFDTAPDHHGSAYRLLSSFGDDSWTYYWRVQAAAQIMRLYRSDPAQLQRLASLQTSAGSDAEVLHPPAQTPGLGNPGSLDRAYARGAIVPLPSNPRALGLTYDSGMGRFAPRLGVPVALYRGLQPVALDLLLNLAARVRTLNGGRGRLSLTSTVEDQRYQQLVGANDPGAAAGWSFTIARRYSPGAQAAALQSELDRLQALNLIAWERYPAEIEVTVASDAVTALHGGI